MFAKGEPQCDAVFTNSVNLPGIDGEQLCVRSYTQSKQLLINLLNMQIDTNMSQIVAITMYIHGNSLFRNRRGSIAKALRVVIHLTRLLLPNKRNF